VCPSLKGENFPLPSSYREESQPFCCEVIHLSAEEKKKWELQNRWKTRKKKNKKIKEGCSSTRRGRKKHRCN